MKWLEKWKHALGVVQGPSHVSVRHDVDFVADGFTNGAYQLEVALHSSRAIIWPPAKTQLHGFITFVFVALGFSGKFIERRTVKPACINRDARLGSAAKQAVDGLFGRFAEQVPERDIHRADTHHPNSLPAKSHRFAIHLLPKQFDVPRIGAEQDWFKVELNHLLCDLRRQRGVSNSDQSVITENFDDQPVMKGKRAHG